MTSFVVDTNVAVVANRAHANAGLECVKACVHSLRNIQQDGRVVLDAGTLILDEYKRNLSLSGQRGVGDAFFKWLWFRRADTERCERVTITPDNGSFLEFPDDPELYRFHSDDRKFVAVAIASKNNPEVLNAVDSDWWDFRDVLTRNGVHVRFLCPEQFKRRRR
jgi:hypothetical protein